MTWTMALVVMLTPQIPLPGWLIPSGCKRSEERRVGKECRSRCLLSHSSRRRHTRYWRDWSSDVCSSDLNPFRYTGRDYDSEAGLYYYRARYYDQTVGRFLSEDDVDDGTSRYAYASNSPSRLVDPFGMQEIGRASCRERV